MLLGVESQRYVLHHRRIAHCQNSASALSETLDSVSAGLAGMADSERLTDDSWTCHGRFTNPSGRDWCLRKRPTMLHVLRHPEGLLSSRLSDQRPRSLHIRSFARHDTTQRKGGTGHDTQTSSWRSGEVRSMLRTVHSREKLLCNDPPKLLTFIGDSSWLPNVGNDDRAGMLAPEMHSLLAMVIFVLRPRYRPCCELRRSMVLATDLPRISLAINLHPDAIRTHKLMLSPASKSTPSAQIPISIFTTVPGGTFSCRS